MRAVLFSLALAALCLNAPAAKSAVNGQTEVFGVTLGAPMSLPACPKDAIANFEIPVECFDGDDSVRFPSSEAPSWVGFFTVTVDDGVVDDIEISNRNGVVAQDQIYSELKNKFGPPTNSSVVKLQNGFGAKFDVIHAVWKRADGVIEFLGDGEITVKSNVFLAHEKQEESRKAHL